MIDIDHVKYDYKRYDDEGNVTGVLHAVDGVTLSIKAGDFVAILGHNGSGKSTLAKQINALFLPEEGSVTVDGMDTKDPDKTLSIRRKAGMVFQNPDNQIVGVTVEEDVGFGPENLGVPTAEIWQRVDEGLDTVDMQKYRKHSPNRLSGGQKQRVAIAGAIAMHPKCIIMDEPTAMLDPNGRKEVLNTIHYLVAQEHMTVVLITHYMEEVVNADLVVVMDNGKVVMQGTPKEIFSRSDELKAYRLDVPQVTMVADELRKNGVLLESGILTIKELVDALCQ